MDSDFGSESDLAPRESLQEILKDQDMFDNTIHALSRIEFQGDLPDRTKILLDTPQARKHVRLLDGLANLITFEKSGDVAATAMILEPNVVTIYWVKNQPIAVTDVCINGIISGLRSDAGIDNILQLVVENAREKWRLGMIFQPRCVKVANAFLASQRDSTPNSDDVFGWRKRNPEAVQGLHDALRKHGYFQKDTDMIKRMDRFIEAAKLANKTTSTATLCNLVRLAYGITTAVSEPKSIPKFKSMNFDILQERRLIKLADYRSLLLITRNEIRKHVKSNVPIRCKQIPAPPIDLRYPMRSMVKALNTLTERRNDIKPLDNLESIQEIFPNARQIVPSGAPLQVTVKATQHCELTMALYLIENHSEIPVHKVGCSKSSCYWCAQYLKALNSEGKVIVTQYEHNKRTDGWILPEESTSIRRAAGTAVRDRLSELALQVFDCVEQRRRSDSQPTGSWHVDGAFVDVGADDVVMSESD
ncbi:MAG: hypothetical protein Q9217_006398 [Psora testacea]